MSDEWLQLINEIKNCKKCPLSKYRRNPVPGEGPRDADIMIIGEAPGAKEDEEGRPFVGAAGKLLTTLLESIGLKRDNVYITNVVKCRPPNNRDPTEEEINTCLPYLMKQIAIIKPKIIIALGRHAARTIFKQAGLVWKNMSTMHGKVYEGTINGHKVIIIPTYHPAAALYKPNLKAILEKDFTVVIASVLRDKEKKRQRSLLDFLK